MAQELTAPPKDRDEFHRLTWKGFVEKSRRWEYAMVRDELRMKLFDELHDKASEAALAGNPQRAAYYEMWANRV